MRDDDAAVTRVIRAAQPHVVCVQEAPRFVRWRSKCAALARRSGLVVVSGGRPAAANLLLSSLSVDVASSRDVTFSRHSRLDIRGASIAVLSLAGLPFAVAGVHLGLETEPRLRQVAELRAILDRAVPADVPVIVAGDVNDQPGSAVWQALAARGSDAWAAAGEGDGLTYSATSPRQRIDAVFADPRLPVRTARVLDDADVRVASDHRPLLVEIDLS